MCIVPGSFNREDFRLFEGNQYFWKDVDLIAFGASCFPFGYGFGTVCVPVLTCVHF